MKTISLILVSMLLLLSNKGMAAYEPSPKEIIVAGRVVNMGKDSQKVIRIDFTDVFAFPTKAQIVGDDGSFRITYLAPYPAQFHIEYGRSIPLYAEPGDSVFVTIDAKKIEGHDYLNAVISSGDRANINNSLWKGLNYISASLRAEYYGEEPSDTLSVPEYNQILEQKISVFRNSISNFVHVNNIPRETEEMIQRILTYEFSNFWVKNYKYSDYSPAASAEKVKLFENRIFETYNPANFKYGIFWHNHTFNYASALFHQYAGEDYHNNEDLKGWIKVREALKEKPAGFNRDYITARVMRYFSEPADSLPGAWELISSPFVKEYIIRTQNQAMPKFDSIDIPGISYLTASRTVEPVSPVDFIRNLSDRYPGKVIHIDVWGTWCGACKDQFPAAKLRKEEMRGKDVVFVYLCISSEMELWLKDVEAFQLEGEHYFLDRDASKLFTANYHIDAYPRYMIVGKDGKVKNNNTLRPVAKEFFTREIESYLYE